MTQEEIIRMAREAGFDPDYFDNIECSCDECNFLKEPLERFAALVAAHERERMWCDAEFARQQEREACAKVCELIGQGGIGDIGDDTTVLCASHIRARGK